MLELAFSYHVGPSNQIQVGRVGRKRLSLLAHVLGVTVVVFLEPRWCEVYIVPLSSVSPSVCSFSQTFD